jgi:hypothetical protein
VFGIHAFAVTVRDSVLHARWHDAGACTWPQAARRGLDLHVFRQIDPESGKLGKTLQIGPEVPQPFFHDKLTSDQIHRVFLAAKERWIKAGRPDEWQETL